MNLNKCDFYAYQTFLKQIKEVFNDETLDKYAPIIAKFINKYYVSGENNLFDLDDFIQEVLFMITRYKNLIEKGTLNEGYLMLNLQRKYHNMFIL